MQRTRDDIESIERRLLALVAEATDRAPSELEPGARLVSDLELDSLALAAFWNELEQAFPGLDVRDLASSHADASLGTLRAVLLERLGVQPSPAAERSAGVPPSLGGEPSLGAESRWGAESWRGAEPSLDMERSLGATPLHSRVSASAAPAPASAGGTPAQISWSQDARATRTTLLLLDALELQSPYFRRVEGNAGASVRIGGRAELNLSTYDYLGSSADARVVEAAVGALRRYGTSASASRIASGERPVHGELERALAEFLGCEGALAFSAGHGMNVSVLGHLLGPEDLIVCDALAHDSILQGARLSRARLRTFAHNDVDALDRVLREQRSQARRALIAVEGAYSMDGDLAPLPEIVEVKRRHSALLFVDEAHSLGTVGATGRGVAEHFGVARTDVDVWMGTLSKALASCGGYVAGRRALIEHLRYTTPGFVYSAAITPANAAAALAALGILASEPERVAKLQRNARCLLEACRRRGLDVGRAGDTPIVPVLVGGSVRCLQLADAMIQAGVNVVPITHPAVEEGKARIRAFVSASHEPAELERAAELLRLHGERLSGDDSARARAARGTHRGRGSDELAQVLARSSGAVSGGAVSSSAVSSAVPDVGLRPAREVRRAFVTGGSGFIGSRVVRRLIDRGVAVCCLSRQAQPLRLAGLPVRLVRGDLQDENAIADGIAGCDAVVHLACVSSWADIRALGDQLETVAVEGTRRVLSAAAAAGVRRFVHVSSVAALNASDEPRVFDESAPYELSNRGLAYSLAKHRADALVADYAARGLDCVTLMPAETFGPHDDDLVTAGTIRDVLEASPAAACDGGTSVVHADDVADGIVAGLLRGGMGERYVLGGENLSVRELAEKALLAAGRRPVVVPIPNGALRRLTRAMLDEGLEPPLSPDVLDYATLYWFVDSSKARRELGYAPRGADETLRDVVGWLRETGRVR